MLTLLEQIDKGTLWQSHGGIHPPEQKTLSNQTKISRLALASEFVVPIPQVGESAQICVQVGDTVLKGQPLTQGRHFAYCAVHAPTSGTVIKIEERVSNHASGLPVLSCVIQADGQDTWRPLTPATLASLSDQEILAKIQHGGVAGLGGGAFPTHIKLNPASDIELVIINGIECEPYITSDDRLMREHSDEICRGIEIIHRLVSPHRIIVAIEDNKPEAASAMQAAITRSALADGIARVTVIPTKYPSGGEKQLIQILTGKEVPSGAIPSQLGILMQNVGTAFAIQDAVLNDKPLIERVVSITGNNTTKAGNYWIPIGTPIEHVLQASGFKPVTKAGLFKKQQDNLIIIGGPMMGHALPDAQAPTLKGTNCLLLPDSQELAPEAATLACIRCGECANVCPASLLPQQLFWHAQAKEYDKAASFNLRDCIECGCCSYVCPSNIPLVEHYRIAKSALQAQTAEKQKADLAKQRFDARLQRLEDEKLAREAKQKEAAARRQSQQTPADSNAIAAAMARIKAKKAADQAALEASANNESTSSATESKSDKVAAAIARAKAKKAAAKADASAETTADAGIGAGIGAAPAVDDKKAKVAAAIARAKAKKAAAKADASAETAADANTDAGIGADPALDDKKAKVAAAIARAKAKKAAAKADASSETATDANTDAGIGADPALDDKKAKVAAAIARAKAKKAAAKAAASAETTADANTDVNTDIGTADPVVDDKKAKVAAAIARAKAKKAAAKAAVSTTEAKSDVVVDNLDASSGSAQSLEPQSEQALKQARIKATIAKAKAKKALAEQQDKE